MGIDNDAALIFGRLLTRDELYLVAEKLGDPDDLFHDDYEAPEFHELYIGSASPWYDADYSDRVGYISLISRHRKGPLTVDEIAKLLTTWKDSKYYELLQFLQIDSRPPQMYALPHIW